MLPNKSSEFVTLCRVRLPPLLCAGYFMGNGSFAQMLINTELFTFKIIFGYGYKIVYTDYTKN